MVNLVSPWVHRKKKEILEWGKNAHPEIVEVKIELYFFIITISKKNC